jgi:RNA polymerase sigma-70 factor (ECF subfamily)
MSEPGRSQAAPPSGDSTSTNLLDGIRANDPQSWDRFVDFYGGLVYYWCRRQGLSTEDAADASQEVFRAVARRVASFQRNGNHGSFQAWLWTITRNKIRDFHRAKARQPEAAGGTEAKHRFEQLPEEPPPTSFAAGKSNASFLRAVEAVRAHFEDRTWKAFWMTVIDGLSVADVAAELGMSVPAVYQAKSRVLLRLREDFRGLID